MIVAVAGVTACGPTRGRCDQAALKAGADATEAMLAAWKPESGVAPDYRLAVRRLQSACPRLAPGFEFFLAYSVHPTPELRSHELETSTPLRDDPDGLGPLLAHCPDFMKHRAAANELSGDLSAARLYEDCNLEALGVFSPEELPNSLDDLQGFHGLALYLWLVNDGAPPAVARTFARPITFGSDYNLRAMQDAGEPVPLPTVAHGAPVASFSMPLLVGESGITFDSKRLVRLDEGRLAPEDNDRGLIGSVYDSVTEEVDKAKELAAKGMPLSTSVTLVVDQRLAWSTAGKVAWTVMRTGASPILVQGLGPDPLHPLAAVPLLSPGAAPSADLAIDPGGLSLRCLTDSHFPALAELPALVASCGATLRLTATPDTSWKRMVDVLGVLADARVAITDIVVPP